jgi:ketosteroid isomerase-like protein
MPTVGTEFFDRLSDAFANDDIDGFLQVVHEDCVWEIMPTGEVFANAVRVDEYLMAGVDQPVQK